MIRHHLLTGKQEKHELSMKQVGHISSKSLRKSTLCQVLAYIFINDPEMQQASVKTEI